MSTVAETFEETNAGSENLETGLDVDRAMAKLIEDIDSVYTAEDETALAQERVYKGSAPCDSPTQEWVE